MKYYAVIGANYGDEGKGMVTYALSKVADPQRTPVLNILHNGGAQRGHTVETPEGKRFVHSHFGSGTLAGAHTYFARNFILNPEVFVEEVFKLSAEHNISPKAYANHLCRVTTPFDMILNQMTEENRSGDKHGSCGMGIFETLRRYSDSHYNKNLGALLNMSVEEIRDYLDLIAKNYLPEKIFERQIKDEIIDKYLPTILSRETIERWLWAFREMVTTYQIGKEIHPNYSRIVCESGQGLAIGQQNAAGYPYLTPSDTGIVSAADACYGELYFGSAIKVVPYYVSRTYFTRHGAGSLENEMPKEQIGNIGIDKTNVPNPWQDTIRYAPLNSEELRLRIGADYARLDERNRSSERPHLVLTHTNEVPVSQFFLKKLKSSFSIHTTDKPWIDLNVD